MSWRSRPRITKCCTRPGSGGVFRSDDGGAGWRRVSDRSEDWAQLEVSPGRPGRRCTALRSPAPRGLRPQPLARVPAEPRRRGVLGGRADRARAHPAGHPALRLRGGGAPPPRARPAARADDRRLRRAGPRPGRAAEPRRGADRRGVRGRGPVPVGRQRGRRRAGRRPGALVRVVFRAGIAYTRVQHSRCSARTTTGSPGRRSWRATAALPTRPRPGPVDFATALAYDPARPDELYAIVEHREPQVDGAGWSGTAARASGRGRAGTAAGPGRTWGRPTCPGCTTWRWASTAATCSPRPPRACTASRCAAHARPAPAPFAGYAQRERRPPAPVRTAPLRGTDARPAAHATQSGMQGSCQHARGDGDGVRPRTFELSCSSQIRCLSRHPGPEQPRRPGLQPSVAGRPIPRGVVVPRAQGLSLRDIAQQSGVSHETVRATDRSNTARYTPRTRRVHSALC